MKILVTADLHYEVSRSRRPARELAREACAEGGDAIVLVGDTAGADFRWLSGALGLFDDFSGLKLMVVGNHCLWSRDSEDSIDRYERTIPQVASEHGFTVLDHDPVVIASVALIGSVGWYDYSFADRSLGIPEEFYKAKVAPGAAIQMDSHRELIETHRGGLTPRSLQIRSRWMDGSYVRLGMSDEAFCERATDRLNKQCIEVSPKVDRIIAFVHHVPFAELLPGDHGDRVAFARAYLGAEMLGNTLLEFPKVSDVYCGHSHWKCERTIGHLRAVNVGSTYSEKRLEILAI